MNKNEKQKAYRLKKGNSVSKKYEKTFNGFIMRMYRNMQSRITGVQSKKSHLYLGKELMSREDFYFIAKNSDKLKALFAEWELSNYNRRLTPSIDRIDSSLGYTLDNVRFVQFHENCRNIKRIVKNKIY
jgi:hypothetical protein